MRRITAKAVLAQVLALAFFAVWASPTHAETAAVRNCTWCHGPAAQGFNPAPRLAGQTRQYIESQIKSFRSHLRDNPDSKQYMWAAAQFVGPQRAHYLAAYFATVPASAAHDGLRELTTFGRRIYQDGIPEANIVACIACHGPNAEGVGENTRF